ncbi:hypothetical protein [Enterococcus sp. AZ163]|uniref:hypothetical protein n=1 Tax=Enterococcus sp. AZ163 TaxID=2774638 RepID=UPI003D29BC76
MINHTKIDKEVEKEIEKLAGTLNDTLPQIELVIKYFEVLSLNFRSRKDIDSLVTMHYTLFVDNSLNSITDLLTNLKNTIDDVSYALDGEGK